MSDKNLIKKFRWFWAWDDEREENWLQEMSNQGLHMKSVVFPGIYTFEQNPDVNYVYRLDYAPETKSINEYITLFNDAGWDYLGKITFWQYFRKKVTGHEIPEIFTDQESKIAKCKKIMWALLGIMPLIVVNLINSYSRLNQPIWFAFAIIFTLFFILFSIGIWKLYKRISQLKRL